MAAAEDGAAAGEKARAPRPELWRVLPGTNGVAVRRRPDTAAQSVDSKLAGAYVNVAFRKGDWVRLHASAGYGPQPAWMHTSGLEKQEVQTWRVTSRGKVPVREEPSMSGRVLGVKSPGSLVKVSHFENNWARMHSREPAWMFRDDLDQQVATDPAESAGRERRGRGGRGRGRGRRRRRKEDGGGTVLHLEDGEVEFSEDDDEDEADDGEDLERDGAQVGAEADKTCGGEVEGEPAKAVDAAALPPSEELAAVRAEKAKAIEAEDYDRAFELKERERELVALVEASSASDARAEEAALAAVAARRAELEKELAQVRTEKAQAVEDEDFKRATELKRRQGQLEEELATLG